MALNDFSPLLPAVGGHFIAGQYQPLGSGEKTFATIAPASDQTLGEVAQGGEACVEAAVAAAEAGLRGPWGRSAPGERARLLRRIGDLILEHRFELARLESLDSGKPLSETLHGDIPRAAANFHFFAELAAHQTNHCYIADDGSQHVTWREPIGIVGLITPWNLPLYLATWKLAPALAQGNAVLLKPAELTPLTAVALGPLLKAAGLPDGVVNIVQGFGPGSTGEAIVRHPAIKAISFTGETTTGSAIMATAAPELKKLSFELGGKGATVIFADADLPLAAATAARAAFRNQGQICLAGSRLIVHESVATEVAAMVVKAAAALRIGDPLDEATTLGSLIARSHRDKVASYVDLARAEGCEVACGGRVPPSFATRGAYYEPTVITGVKQESRLIQEEIFGPVLTVQTFRSEEEMAALVNGVPYGLSCSIFTRDLQRAARTARAVRSGLVWINSWFLRDLHTAFGGMKRSGVGREGGQYSLDFFAEMKTVTTAAPTASL